jgi:Fic family protein
MTLDAPVMKDESLDRSDEARLQSDGQLLTRICSEYLDMPGLYLTAPQAARLFGVERTTCEALLTRLVQVRFLRRTPAGFYGLLDRSTASQFEIYVS